MFIKAYLLYPIWKKIYMIVRFLQNSIIKSRPLNHIICGLVPWEYGLCYALHRAYWINWKCVACQVRADWVQISRIGQKYILHFSFISHTMLHFWYDIKFDATVKQIQIDRKELLEVINEGRYLMEWILTFTFHIRYYL